MTTKSIKHICDRCGNYVAHDLDPMNGSNRFPKDWQHVQLGQTGAKIDLCALCNLDLHKFLASEGAENMQEACFNSRKETE